MDPEQVVAEFDRAVDAGDVDALDAVCDPDMITHSFGPSMPQGIEGMRKFVSARQATGGVGEWEQVVVVARGEYVVQFGTRTYDWPGGKFRGFDVPAGSARRDCAFLFRVRNGLITDRWAIRDDLAMLALLGAVTPTRPDELLHGTVTSYRDRPFDWSGRPMQRAHRASRSAKALSDHASGNRVAHLVTLPARLWMQNNPGRFRPGLCCGDGARLLKYDVDC